MVVRRWLLAVAIVVLVLGAVQAIASPRAAKMQDRGLAAAAPGDSSRPSGDLGPAPYIGAAKVDAHAVSARATVSALVGSVAQPLSPSQEAELEEFRSRLKAWAEDMNVVYPYLAAFADPGVGGVLGALPQDIDEMAPEQLAAVAAVFTEHPAWWDFPDFLLALLSPDGNPMPLYYAALVDSWEGKGEIDHATAMRLGEQAEAKALRQGRGASGPPAASGAVVPGEGDLADAVLTPNPTQSVPLPTRETFPARGALPDPQAPSRPGCPGQFEDTTCDGCVQYVPLASSFAAKVVSIIAKGISDAIPKDVKVALFPGIGVQLPNPVKPIFLAISQAAEAVSRGLEFNNALANDCHTAFHNALTDLYLDATVSSRVTQSSLDRQALLSLRTAIEENLLRLADERISLFQVPGSVCGLAIPDDNPSTVTGYEGIRFCGQLEYVREIVDDTITRNAAAGMTPELQQAAAELDAGDAHYMISQWKSAYERYSAAYKLAVKQPAGR